MEDWKLYKCLYDYMGMETIEEEDPKRFKEILEKYPDKDIGWFIGTAIPVDHMPNGVAIKIELEGSKENLEKVLELIKMKG